MERALACSSRTAGRATSVRPRSRSSSAAGRRARRSAATIAGAASTAPGAVSRATSAGNATAWSRAATRSGTPNTRFARDLADHLEKAANEHRFDRLVLVAAPRALGDLRGLLPKTVQGKVVAQIDKDLTNIPTRDLGKHLDAHLPH